MASASAAPAGGKKIAEKPTSQDTLRICMAIIEEKASKKDEVEEEPSKKDEVEQGQYIAESIVYFSPGNEITAKKLVDKIKKGDIKEFEKANVHDLCCAVMEYVSTTEANKYRAAFKDFLLAEEEPATPHLWITRLYNDLLKVPITSRQNFKLLFRHLKNVAQDRGNNITVDALAASIGEFLLPLPSELTEKETADNRLQLAHQRSRWYARVNTVLVKLMQDGGCLFENQTLEKFSRVKNCFAAIEKAELDSKSKKVTCIYLRDCKQAEVCEFFENYFRLQQVDLGSCDLTIVGGAVKIFFDQLPEPLLPIQHFNALEKAKVQDEENVIKQGLQKCQDVHCLGSLCRHLNTVATHNTTVSITDLAGNFLPSVTQSSASVIKSYLVALFTRLIEDHAKYFQAKVAAGPTHS